MAAVVAVGFETCDAPDVPEGVFADACGILEARASRSSESKVSRSKRYSNDSLPESSWSRSRRRRPL